MLIPLLGIPNIMQTIPFSPTQENITYFAIWTYCASLSYMYQGFMIAIIYCFTNREVQSVLHNCYTRHRLSHSRRVPHRSSRYAPMASPYTQIRNNSSSLGANGVGGGIKGIVGIGVVNMTSDCLLLPPHSKGTLSSRTGEFGVVDNIDGTDSLITNNLTQMNDHGTRTTTTESMLTSES